MILSLQLGEMRRKVRRLIVRIAVSIESMPSKQNEEIQRRFGTRLRLLRHKKGLSQEALAFSCGLDRTYIGSVERGERNISLVNIHIIAESLGVPVKDLFND